MPPVSTENFSLQDYTASSFAVRCVPGVVVRAGGEGFGVCLGVLHDFAAGLEGGREGGRGGVSLGDLTEEDIWGV